MVDTRHSVHEPAHHRARQYDPQRRHSDIATRVQRVGDVAAVDGGCIHPGVRWPAADDGFPGRPVRSQAGASGRACDLRAVESVCGVRGFERAADHGTGVDGDRRGTDHAVYAVDTYRCVPAGGARQGHRHLGRSGRSRHRYRSANRWSAARKLLVGLSVFRQHPHHRRRDRRRVDPGPGKPRPASKIARIFPVHCCR